MMQTLTISEIDDFIQKMKNGKTVMLSGEYDPDPYGGGTHWNFEMQYNFEKQVFVLKTNFYPSQYHTEPEVSCKYLDEEQTIAYLLHQNKDKVSCW